MIKSVIAALSVPEHCLSCYFVCDGDDQIQISYAVWLRKMENLVVALCYLWLTEKLWLLGGTASRAPPPFKTLITLLPVTISQHDPQLGVLVVDRLSFNQWLKLFICQTFSRLAFGIKGCSFKTRFISSIYRLLWIALRHHVREHIIYTVYSDCVLVLAFAFLPCKKKSA